MKLLHIALFFAIIILVTSTILVLTYALPEGSIVLSSGAEVGLNAFQSIGTLGLAAIALWIYWKTRKTE